MPQATATPKEQTSVQRQIARAHELERDRDTLFKKIDANRKYLRLMQQNDELNDEQEDWLDAFYPQKERGERRTTQEVEDTRRVREAARKGNDYTG